MDETPMHQTTTQSLISLILIGSLANTYAAGPAIGVALANGPFEVGSAQVKGNANLFDGSAIATAAASSKLRLNGGARIEIGTDSRAKVYAGRLVLEQGAGQLQGPAAYAMEARTLRISTSTPNSIARVQLDGPGAVLVSAVNGPVRVANSAGALVASIAPGRNFRFQPQDASGSSFDVSGCLLRKNNQFILVDQTTNQMFELRGTDLNKSLGNRVNIKGSPVADSKPMEGAANFIQVQSMTQTAPGGCLATAAGIGADPLPGANVAPAAKEAAKAGGANKAVILGVIVAAGAAAGVGVALGSKSKSQ